LPGRKYFGPNQGVVHEISGNYLYDGWHSDRGGLPERLQSDAAALLLPAGLRVRSGLCARVQPMRTDHNTVFDADTYQYSTIGRTRRWHVRACRPVFGHDDVPASGFYGLSAAERQHRAIATALVVEEL
jgi:hypothetical protein